MAERELPGMALLRVLEGKVSPQAADYGAPNPVSKKNKPTDSTLPGYLAN